MFVVITTIISFIAGVAGLAALLSKPEGNENKAAHSLRIKAVDCKQAAYRDLQRSRLAQAQASFRCAEENFRKSADLGDDLALWGLSLLYGDKTFRTEMSKDDREYIGKAVDLWCQARRKGVTAAAGDAPFAEDTKC